MIDLAKMMPDAFRVFFRGRRPWEAQVAVMPRVVAGESILFCAPTASGKTEAVIAPLYQRHVSFNRETASIVMVAPTKALVNDLFARLSDHLHERSPSAVARYTGDHHEFKTPEKTQIIVATPEALDSLQLTRPEMLRGIRAVVVDEVHLLHGTARGQQLRRVLDRLEAGVGASRHPKDAFQRVAMSATLDDPEAVARLWLGSAASWVISGVARQIEMTWLDAQAAKKSDFRDRGDKLAEFVKRGDFRKLLVFVNSRNGAQALAYELSKHLRGSHWPVHLHHGLLGAAERERVELAMKTEATGVCVATATLEIGIDIGDIDLIVLADIPQSISAFLQRIGRGNRRTSLCRVAVTTTGPAARELVEALLECARIGQMDDVHEYERPSVGFQQVLSLAWRGVRHPPALTRRTVAVRAGGWNHDDVVTDMLATGHLAEKAGALIPSDAMMDRGDRREIHTVIAGPRRPCVVDMSTGDVLLTADVDNAERSAVFVRGELRNVLPSSAGQSTAVGRPARNDTPLAMLPSSILRASTSRAVIWQIARARGHDPMRWLANGTTLTTWGGETYNLLAATVLALRVGATKYDADSFAIRGLSDADAITPQRLLELTETAQQRDLIPLDVARRFLTTTRFFRYLSPQVQDAESLAAIPFRGFKHWLSMCQASLATNTASPAGLSTIAAGMTPARILGIGGLDHDDSA